ncbi:MAG: ComEA family DNA-binding protein [Planctomycetaceae bacterium]
MQQHHSGPFWFPAPAQTLVAWGTGLALVAMAAWFLLAGGLSGGLVDHDRPPPPSMVFTIDVNTAPVGELAQLPGLGPALAARIVEHRREHGPFDTAAGLLDVPGIGPAILERMRPHLRPLGGSGPPSEAVP